jgi:hypothetical protein
VATDDPRGQDGFGLDIGHDLARLVSRLPAIELDGDVVLVTPTTQRLLRPV